MTARTDSFTNVTFEGNGAYASAVPTALSTALNAWGGAIEIAAGTSLTLTSATFTNNYALVSGGSPSPGGKAAGGGIYQTAAKLYLYSSNFTANYASGWRVRTDL